LWSPWGARPQRHDTRGTQAKETCSWSRPSVRKWSNRLQQAFASPVDVYRYERDTA